MTRFLDDGVGRVRLGTGAAACIHTLPPVLGALRKALPKPEIVITVGEAQETVAAVEGNAVDVGFVSLPVVAGRSLSVESIVDDEVVAVFPADGEIPSDTGAETPARGPLILHEANGNCRRRIDIWFLNSGVAAKPVMSLGSVEAIKAMVGVGIGHAILPSSAVRGAAGDGLTFRSFSPKLFTTHAVVVRRDKRLTRSLREMIAAPRGPWRPSDPLLVT